MKPHRGSTILVFGILGLLLCQIFGIAAWTMGNNDLQEMDAGLMDPAGKDLTNAGRILGMVATGLLILQAAIVIVAIMMMLVAGNR
jgi:hypothetical protein